MAKPKHKNSVSMLITEKQLVEHVFDMMQASLEHGAMSIDRIYTTGLVQQDLNVVDMHEGPLWIISWKDDYRAVVRTRDSQTAWMAGLEFASLDGNPFAVADVYDWSTDLMRNKKNRTVSTKQLKVELLSLELAQGLHLNFQIRHSFCEESYKKELDDLKRQDEATS